MLNSQALVRPGLDGRRPRFFPRSGHSSRPHLPVHKRQGAHIYEIVAPSGARVATTPDLDSAASVASLFGPGHAVWANGQKLGVYTRGRDPVTRRRHPVETAARMFADAHRPAALHIEERLAEYRRRLTAA